MRRVRDDRLLPARSPARRTWALILLLLLPLLPAGDLAPARREPVACAAILPATARRAAGAEPGAPPPVGPAPMLAVRTAPPPPAHRQPPIRGPPMG